MKKTAFISAFSALLLIAAATIFSCSKTETVSGSKEDYSYVSEIEKMILAENDNLKADGINECIYTCINAMPYDEPSMEEVAVLQFVREEELLAHDVYAALYGLFPLPVFNNISKSETIHTTAIKALLEKYNLPDPAVDHQAGIFVHQDIQALYDALITQGSASLNEALVVGAIIEDWDIADLIHHIEFEVDNVDIDFVLSMLYKGSRNHLRAFHAHLTFRNITYSPQYISQDLYNAITSSGWEAGNGFCLCQYSTAPLLIESTGKTN